MSWEDNVMIDIFGEEFVGHSRDEDLVKYIDHECYFFTFPDIRNVKKLNSIIVLQT